jgi:hypothetical protein
MIPLAFATLIFYSIGYTIKNINLYLRGDQSDGLSLSLSSPEDNQ